MIHLLTLARGRLRRARGIISIFDQALISAGNFGTGVILARTLDPPVFGVFVLANLTLWLTLAVQNAVTLQPLVVNGAALGDGDFRRYLRANLPLQAAFIACSSLMVAGVAVLWEPFRALALPLAVAAVFFQGQEFCRRVLYTRLHLKAAVLNNVVNYDLQAVLVGALAWAGVLGLASALWAIALTSLLASLLGVWQLRRFASHEREDVGSVARRNFQLAKWLLPSTILASVSAEAYPFLLANLAGLAATAGYGVIRQVMGPIQLLARPLENYYLPRATRAVAEAGTPGITRVLWRAVGVTAPPYLLYLLAVAAAPAFLLERTFGPAYGEYAPSVRLFVLAALLYFPLLILRIEVNARRLQRYVFVGEAWVALVVYSFGLYLIAQYSIDGAAITTLLAIMGQLGLFLIVVVRARRGAPGVPVMEAHSLPAPDGRPGPVDQGRLAAARRAGEPDLLEPSDGQQSRYSPDARRTRPTGTHAG